MDKDLNLLYYNSNSVICASAEEVGYVATALARAGYMIFINNICTVEDTCKYEISFTKLKD